MGPGGGELRPGGVAPPEPLPVEHVLRAVERTRAEMAERDAELREVLARLAELYAGLAAQPDDHSLAALLRSVDTLAAVTEASVDRASDLSRSVQRLVETMSGVSQRVDRLTARADNVDGTLAGVRATLDRVAEQVTLMGRALGTPAASRPALRAVGREEAAEIPH